MEIVLFWLYQKDSSHKANDKNINNYLEYEKVLNLKN